MSRTRTLLVLITGLVIGTLLSPTGASTATADSASGISAVTSGKRCTTVDARMNVTAATKVAATVVTDAPGAAVQRVFRKPDLDRFRICLTEAATQRIRVTWIAHNFEGLADAAHLHDVRYYTKTQSNDRFVPARKGYVRTGAHDMRPTADGTGWEFATGWRHQSSARSECISGRIELPISRNVTAMSIVYAAPAGPADLQVVLGASRATAGSIVSGIPPIATLDGTAAKTGIWDFAELSIPVPTPAEVLEDYTYYAVVCTQDVIEIIGADVSIG